MPCLGVLVVVRPGSGWPADPATARTPVATDAGTVVALANAANRLPMLDARVSVCCACPRLVAWREEVAGVKRRAFADEPYWGRPIPGFGAERPAVLILGLAPAAHGGNRTGRIFTGDRSGDWLFAGLYRTGLSPTRVSAHAGDGLVLDRVRIVAAVRCAPPANRPTPGERDTCAPWLVRELTLTWPSVRSVVVLGQFGWDALWPALRAAGIAGPRRKVPFGHGIEVGLTDGRTILSCYHVSQQNTFTGRLTEAMLDAVLNRARVLADAASA
ncbi:MAG: uracil-DNA glycosylase [bacterium]